MKPAADPSKTSFDVVTVMIAVVIAALALCGCATGPDVKPYNGGGIELVSEQLGWEGPPLPAMASVGTPAPMGSIDFTGSPIQVRVGVRNGRAYPMKFTLACGEVGVSSYRVVTVVEAAQERGLYFSMSRRIGPQRFECRIEELTSIIGAP